MNQWQGNQIRLRAIEPEDYEFFYNWNLDTDTQRQLAWIWFPTSKESVREWAKETSLKKGEKDEFFFVIENLAGELVGSINANSVNKIDGTFRYGIAIVEGHRKKGYASEAITLFLDYYFNELRYHKVNAGVFAYNRESILLHEKLGFVTEGQLRETKYTRGKYWDMILFGLTKDEFNQKFE